MTRLASLPLAVAMFAAAAAQPARPHPADSEPNEVLTQWVHEPIAVEGLHYRLLLDRRDGSFVFHDRRADKSWYSSWGRRGFASVLLKGGGGDDRRWVALEKIETQQIQEKKVTFTGKSSDGAARIRWVVEAVENHEGVRFRYTVPRDDRERVLAVRLLDGCLWAGGDEHGEVFLPQGMGQRWRTEGEPRSVTFAHPALQAPEAAASPGAPRAYTMRMLAVAKGSRPVLIDWPRDDVTVKVERKAMVPGAAGAAGGFPGKSGLFVSVESAAPSAEVRIFSLGEVKLGVGDAVRRYRGLLAPQEKLTLRFKTGKDRAHRALIGAPIFRPEVGPRRTFAQVADFAERLHDRLGVDRAAFLLREWSARDASAGTPTSRAQRAFTPRSDAGGEKGALHLSKALKALGFIGGVDLPVSALDAGARPAGAPELWRQRISRVQASDTLAALKERCAPHMVVWDFTESTPAGRRAAFSPAGKNCRRALGRYSEELIGLAGVVRGAEQDLEFSSYFGASLPPVWREAAADGVVDWPLFSLTYSHCVRLARPARQPLRGDDARGVLHHLLVGEVPLYAWPGEDAGWRKPAPRPGAATAEQCFSQLDGWARGLELTAYEVFLKNTYELLSHVARYRARTPMMYHRSLTPGGTVKETYFGTDMRIVVNFGAEEYEDESEGFVLPQHGFYVRYPFLLAFHATRVHKVDYDRPAFFVVRSLEGKMIYRAKRVKIYHGFGPSKIRLAGRDFEVPRETVTRIW